MTALEAIARGYLTYAQFGAALTKLPADPHGMPCRLLVDAARPVILQIHSITVGYAGRRIWIWDCNPAVIEVLPA